MELAMGGTDPPPESCGSIALRKGAYRRRAPASSAGLTQPLSAGLRVTPGGTISSMRSRTSVGSCVSAAVSCDCRWSMVRGPMMAAVIAGWRMMKAYRELDERDAGVVGELGELFDGVELALVHGERHVKTVDQSLPGYRNRSLDFCVLAVTAG